jgi:adenosylhomocysteine nucleosidase
MERNKIGFVTGLAVEARLLRDSGFLVTVGGGMPDGAYRAADTLAGRGALALISFGLAGGLRPDLQPGTVLVPPAVAEGPRTYFCDDRLIEFLGGSTGHPIMAGMKIAATAPDKEALFRRGRADAIDLESGAVARVALARGLPFAVLRAVADPAERNLPPAALIALKPGGGIDLPRILLSVLARPAQIPGLLAVGKDAGRARAALVERLKRLRSSP